MTLLDDLQKLLEEALPVSYKDYTLTCDSCDPTYVRITKKGDKYHTMSNRANDMAHILKLIRIIRELRGVTDISQEDIEKIERVFSIVDSIVSYGTSSLEKILNNKYLEGDLYDLSRDDRIVVITYYMSIFKGSSYAGEDGEGCSYNSRELEKII